MTTPPHPSLTPERISCSVCRREIPLSSALTPQGEDYVLYFCGIECYEEFAAEQRSEPPQEQQNKQQQK